MSVGRERPRRGMLAIGIAVLACSSALVGCTEQPEPPTPTRPPVAFAAAEVTSVGDIEPGTESELGLIIQFAEAAPAAISRGTGVLQVTLTDHAGLSDSLQFIGLPVVEGPGSLGATAILNGRNMMTVSIVDSDPLNFEPLRISGLGIRASSTAAIGAINAVVGGCAGSLAGCTLKNVLPSPGNIVTQ
jgi:hypothetical protein